MLCILFTSCSCLQNQSLDELMKQYPIHGPIYDCRNGGLSLVHELFKIENNSILLDDAVHRGKNKGTVLLLQYCTVFG